MKQGRELQSVNSTFDWKDNLAAILQVKLTFKRQSLSIFLLTRLTPFCQECTSELYTCRNDNSR